MGNISPGEADERPHHTAMLNQTLDDRAGHGRADREADPLGVAQDGSVDAYHLAIEVDQGPAAVTLVNRGVGLQEVVQGTPIRGEGPTQGTYDAQGDGRSALQCQDVAQRDHPVTDIHVIGVAEADRCQIFGLDLEDRDVG